MWTEPCPSEYMRTGTGSEAKAYVCTTMQATSSPDIDPHILVWFLKVS